MYNYIYQSRTHAGFKLETTSWKDVETTHKLFEEKTGMEGLTSPDKEKARWDGGDKSAIEFTFKAPKGVSGNGASPGAAVGTMTENM